MSRVVTTRTKSVSELINVHERFAGATYSHLSRSSEILAKTSSCHGEHISTGNYKGMKQQSVTHTKTAYENDINNDIFLQRKSQTPLRQSVKNISFLVGSTTLHEENEPIIEEGAGSGHHGRYVRNKHFTAVTPVLKKRSLSVSTDQHPDKRRMPSGDDSNKIQSSSGVTGSLLSLPATTDKVFTYVNEQSRNVLTNKKSSRVASESNIRIDVKEKSLSKHRSETGLNENVAAHFFPLSKEHVSVTSWEGSSITPPFSDAYTDHKKIQIAESTDSRLKNHHEKSLQSTTRRFAVAKDILDKLGIVFIKAHEGDGSTHLSFELLSAFESYRPFILQKPSHIQICIRGEENAIFMADDAFGREKYKDRIAEKWHSYLECYDMYIKSGSIKIILVVKNCIAERCSYILDSRRESVVDLTEVSLQLNTEEKIDLLKAVVSSDRPALGDEIIEEIAKRAWSIGFPKRVREFLKQIEKDEEEFFLTPSSYLMKMVKAMNMVEHSKFVTLALVFLSPQSSITDKNIDQALASLHLSNFSRSILGNLHTKKAKIKSKDKALRLLQKIVTCEESKDSNRLNALLLEGTLLTVNKGYYALAAACIETAIWIELAQKYMSEVISCCSDQFFAYFVHPECATEAVGLKVPLSDSKSCSVAIQRLITLFLDTRVAEAATHSLFTDPLFVREFFRNVKNEPGLTRKVLLAKDKESGKSIVSLGFETVYKTHKDGNTETLGGTILCCPKWKDIRKRKYYQEWTDQEEAFAIKACCTNRLEDTFFKVCDCLRLYYKLDGKDFKEYLQLSAQFGADRIFQCLLSKLKGQLTQCDLTDILYEASFAYSQGDCQTDNRERIIEQMLEHISFDIKCSGVESIIHRAARTDNGRLLVVLEMFKADINLPNEFNETCLHVAAKFNKPFFASVAMEKGADPTRRDKEGKYPIHTAANTNEENLVFKLFVEKHPESVHFEDYNKRKSLHFACKQGSIENIRFILEHGAGAEVKDIKGRTPLHYASMHSNFVTEILLKKEVAIDVVDEDGETPIEAACRAGSLSVVQQLYKLQDTRSPKCLFNAIKSQKSEVVEFLLQEGFDLEARNHQGLTPCQYAIRHSKALIWLLQKYSENMLETSA